MSKKHIVLPTVVVLDEWTKEISGYEFTFQIKRTSGGDKPTWYPVTFWKSDYTRLSNGGKFDERPERKQVEEYFASSVESYITTYIKREI